MTRTTSMTSSSGIFNNNNNYSSSGCSADKGNCLITSATRDYSASTFGTSSNSIPIGGSLGGSSTSIADILGMGTAAGGTASTININSKNNSSSSSTTPAGSSMAAAAAVPKTGGISPSKPVPHQDHSVVGEAVPLVEKTASTSSIFNEDASSKGHQGCPPAGLSAEDQMLNTSGENPSIFDLGIEQQLEEEDNYVDKEKDRRTSMININKSTPTTSNGASSSEPEAADALNVPVDYVGLIIGAGGRSLQKIKAHTGASVTIIPHPNPDDMNFKSAHICGNREQVTHAKEVISAMIESARQAKNGLEEHHRQVAKGELPRDARYVPTKPRGLEFLEDDDTFPERDNFTPMGGKNGSPHFREQGSWYKGAGPYGGGKMKGAANSASWSGPIGGKGSQHGPGRYGSISKHHKFYDEFEVPRRYLGLFIGKRGESIRTFRERAAALNIELEVDQQTEASSGIVRISSDNETDVTQLKRDMMAKLQQDISTCEEQPRNKYPSGTGGDLRGGAKGNHSSSGAGYNHSGKDLHSGSYNGKDYSGSYHNHAGGKDHSGYNGKDYSGSYHNHAGGKDHRDYRGSNNYHAGKDQGGGHNYSTNHGSRDHQYGGQHHSNGSRDHHQYTSSASSWGNNGGKDNSSGAYHNGGKNSGPYGRGGKHNGQHSAPAGGKNYTHGNGDRMNNGKGNGEGQRYGGKAANGGYNNHSNGGYNHQNGGQHQGQHQNHTKGGTGGNYNNNSSTSSGGSASYNNDAAQHVGNDFSNQLDQMMSNVFKSIAGAGLVPSSSSAAATGVDEILANALSGVTGQTQNKTPSPSDELQRLLTGDPSSGASHDQGTTQQNGGSATALLNSLGFLPNGGTSSTSSTGAAANMNNNISTTTNTISSATSAIIGASKNTKSSTACAKDSSSCSWLEDLWNSPPAVDATPSTTMSLNTNATTGCSSAHAGNSDVPMVGDIDSETAYDVLQAMASCTTGAGVWS
ncbi:unnamed protein product [Amoebophrya sp. A25]|nr:unnamed protein product [Amoebophrya sp. A25]|eukprot:GSA25T00019238001.1